jgi:hypothetical protein
MWIPLGEVSPRFDLWLPFPNGENAGGASVFRVRFFSDGNLENVFSYLWFRRVWRFGTFRDKEVERAEKIYPQIHSLIINIPIPTALEYSGLFPAGYECKLERRFRRGAYAEPIFYISLDAWIASPGNPSGSPIIEQQQAEEQIAVNTQEIDDLAQEIQELSNLINNLQLPP